MLRRLISAVFVLSLVLALNGTAISDVTKGELNPVIKVDPSNERYYTISDARPQQPTFKKPEDALKVLPPGMSAPTPPYFFDVQDYTNGVPYYYWPIPDVYGDDLFNMRFTSDAGYDCEVIQAHYLMYGTAMTGTPDMRCYIWDDDMFGFPGAKLDSVDIPYAGLPTSGIAYVTAVFPGTHVFSDGEEHHLGWTMIGGIGDTLAIISDDATPPSSLEERASEFWGGMWGTMLNDWLIDVSFFILNERECTEIPYTDCYWQYYYQNLAYFWQAPHPSWGDVAYAMRYDVGGRETLQFIDVLIYDVTGHPDYPNYVFGNDDVFMTVYDDDGAGLPGAQIAQVVIPPGGYVAYPAWQRFNFDYVLTPQNNLTSNKFHIAFSSSAILGSGDFEACLSSDGTDGVGRSSSDWGGGYWVDFLSGWGLDANFIFDAYLCKDAYYECAWKWCYISMDWFWRLPDAYGDYAHAQKFLAPGEECQVMDVVWYLYDNGDPGIYTHQSEVQVYSDAGGLPGTKLAGITIGPGSAYPYVLFPGGMLVDFEPLGVTVSENYWVGIESFGPYDEGIRTLSDDGGGGCVDGLAENWMGYWELLWPYWGGGMAQDIAAIVEEKQCCIPYGGMTCYPSEDWPTYQRDYARTGHSMNAVGDAWCDLTLNWNYIHPTLGTSYPSCGPIIAYDKVVQAFSSSSVSEYKVFDLISGALLYTLAGGPIGAHVRSTPTVAMIAGYPDPILFTSGGLVGKTSAWDFNTGAPLWTRADYGTCGVNRWARFTLVNVGGIDVLVWGTTDGCVLAADALTGLLFDNVNFPGLGWMTNPVMLPLPTNISGATDGYHLYYNTFGGNGPTGVEGDVYSIDASTGLIIWQLSATSGLQGVNVWTHDSGYFNVDEGFTSGIMYDDGTIYTNSRAEAHHPTDGLFYSINAATGMVNYATLSNRVYYSTPIMDRNHVYMPTYTRWMQPPGGGNLLSFKKNTGIIDKTFTSANADRYYVDGVVSCEPEDGEYPDDLIYVFDEGGFLSCVNSVTFEEVYRRRINFGTAYALNIGMAGAIAHDVDDQVHVVFAGFNGLLFDMTKQDDRPRLQIETYNPVQAVEFGPDPTYDVWWDSVFYNSGCADLHFDYVNVDEDVCPGMAIPDFASNVDPDFMDRANKIADDLARDWFLSKYMRPNSKGLDENGMQSVREMDFEKETINRAAAGWPPYLVSVDWPIVGSVLSPGVYHSLDLTVNQPVINRGPQCFYLTVSTNDPDFFLDDPTQDPCMFVCLIGGCLLDTTTLWFGASGANYQLVSNTGRTTSDDWSPSFGIDIEGDDDAMWAGAYWHAVSQHRLAIDLHRPLFGPLEGWYSWQADPNWCDDACKPYLDATLCIGPELTKDGGQTYAALATTEVCASGVDSVQDYSLGVPGDWDWENFGAPFHNDSTMGLYVKSVTIGVNDADAGLLGSMTLEVFQFTERNSQEILDWKFGLWCDTDAGVVAGDKDSMFIDRSISTVWNTAATQFAHDAAWGFIKVPFGCGTGADHTPLKNVVTLDSDNSLYGANAGDYFDSTYYYASLPPGEYSMPNAVSQRDQSMHATLVEKDTIDADESFTFGVAVFGLHGMTDPQDPAELVPLANLVNQFAGWGRGDVNNDGAINLADIVYLAATVNVTGAPGAVPFKHLSDVNADGNIDILDVDYLIDFYFNCGPCPMGAWLCSP